MAPTLDRPENAEHELKIAYNCTIDAGVIHFWDRKLIPGVNPYEVVTLYKRAFDAYRNQQRLPAERWARAAKHLARAFWHEAKTAYLEPRAQELPFLEKATEEYDLYRHSVSAQDLLDSISKAPPPGMTAMPEEMTRYLNRARKHLATLEDPTYVHELLRTERSKAAYEYGRTLECLALAYEAENSSNKVA